MAFGLIVVFTVGGSELRLLLWLLALGSIAALGRIRFWSVGLRRAG